MTEEHGRKGPFLRGENSTRRIMGDVALALMPAFAGSIYFFGLRSLLLVVTSVITCVLSEFVWEWLTGKQITAFDFSAVVTGILIAFQVPVTTPVILIITQYDRQRRSSASDLSGSRNAPAVCGDHRFDSPCFYRGQQPRNAAQNQAEAAALANLDQLDVPAAR